MKTIKKIVKYPKTLDELNLIASHRKVAVYTRVSTSSDEQMNSVEAQKDYYIKLIAARPEWEFCGLYSDEGISGVSHRHRDGFNRMMNDAEIKKFNLIITKSISRFARNTVDSLVCIRRLKELGTEVYFEKEDLWTFDSKGEFMLTLLSSMAQDESRSISENVAWGVRKRFADGKYSVPFKNFLGYDRGTHGELVINEEQARVVRLIFRLFLAGKSMIGIARALMDLGAPTPSGKEKWSQTVIRSILTNEKYKGDALLQKRFTEDYLTKKEVVNTGELPQYYVTAGHDAIIPRATFDYAQELLGRRKEEYDLRYSCSHALSAKIICGDCGGWFGLKSAHSGTERTFYWYCNNRFKHDIPCRSPRIRKRDIHHICQHAIAALIRSRESIIDATIRALSPAIHPANGLGTKKERLEEITVFLKVLIDSKPPCIELSDEVITIVIERITAMEDGLLVFDFLDGCTWEYRV